MKKLGTKQICLIGILSAIYVILSYLSIGSNDFKASIESLAILVAAVIFGPLGGMLTGLVGEFVHQLLLYGLDATTVFWLMPYVIEGLVAGFIAKPHIPNLEKKHLVLAIAIGELTLTTIVTPVNWIAATIQGWGYWQAIAAAIPFRLLVMVIRIVIYIFILPLLYKSLKKSAL